MSHLIFSHL